MIKCDEDVIEYIKLAAQRFTPESLCVLVLCDLCKEIIQLPYLVKAE